MEKEGGQGIQAFQMIDHGWTMIFITYDLTQIFQMSNCFFRCHFWVKFWKCLASLPQSIDQGKGDGEMCSSSKTFIFFSSYFSHVLRSDAAVLLCSSGYTIYQRMCWLCMSLKCVEVEQATSRNESIV